MRKCLCQPDASFQLIVLAVLCGKIPYADMGTGCMTSMVFLLCGV